MTQIMRRSSRERKKPTAIYQVEDKRKEEEEADASEPEEEDQMSDKENQQLDEEEESNEEEDGDDDDQEEDFEPVKKSQPKKKKSPQRPPKQPRKKKLRPVREERKKKPTKEGHEAEGEEDDVEEDEDVFFEAIKRGKCSLNNLMVEWRERYMENEADATREVLNFVLQACGGQGECVPSTESLDKLDMADLVDYVLDDLEKTNEEYPIASTKQKAFKKFHTNFVDFWKAFIKECHQSEILFQSQSIVERFVDWLTSLSSAEIRAIRHTTTIAAYAIGTALVDCVIAIQEQLALVKRQLEAEDLGGSCGKKKKKKATTTTSNSNSNTSASNKSMALLKNKNLFEEHLEKVTDLINQLFNGVIVHRYRDVMPSIRKETMTTLGTWIRLFPDHFLKDQYLKYLGWMLNDKHPSVRLMVVEQLQKLYETFSLVEKMELFTERFLGRFLELCMDMDDEVVHASIRLLIQIDQRGLIGSDIDLEPVEQLVFEEKNQAIRKAAAEFVCLQYDAFGIVEAVNEITCPPSMNSNTTKTKSIKSKQLKQKQLQLSVLNQKQLSTQAVALVEFCEEYLFSPTRKTVIQAAKQAPKLFLQNAFTTFVDAFWGLEDCQVLNDWKLMTRLLLMDSQTPDLTNEQQTVLIRLLVTTVKKHLTDSSSSEENLQEEMSLFFCQELSSLFQRFQSDDIKLALLMDLLPLLHFSNALMDPLPFKHVKELMNRLKKVFLSHTNEHLIHSIAHAMDHFLRTSTETIQREIELVLHEMITTVMNTTKDLLDQEDNNTLDNKKKRRSSSSRSTSSSSTTGTLTKQDVEFALRTSLCRLASLSKAVNLSEIIGTLKQKPTSSTKKKSQKNKKDEQEEQEEQEEEEEDNEMFFSRLCTLVESRTSKILTLSPCFWQSKTLEYVLICLYCSLLWKMELLVDQTTSKQVEQNVNVYIDQVLQVRDRLEMALMHVFEMHLAKNQREEDEKEDSPKTLSAAGAAEELVLENPQVAAYVKQARRMAFFLYCDLRCLFVEKFRQAVAPFDRLYWKIPKTLELLSQMLFENEMDEDEENEEEDDEEEEDDQATEKTVHKHKYWQERLEVLLALGRVAMCHPSQKRQAAAVLRHLTSTNKGESELIKIFSRQIKAQMPVRYLEIQMTSLRQAFNTILALKEELEEVEEEDETKEALSEQIASSEASLKELGKKFSQALGVGKIASSLKAPFLRFLSEGVRFAMEKPSHFAFLEALRSFLSHVDKANLKQLHTYFEQLLEKTQQEMDQEEEARHDEAAWRFVFDFQATLKSLKSGTAQGPRLSLLPSVASSTMTKKASMSPKASVASTKKSPPRPGPKKRKSVSPLTEQASATKRTHVSMLESDEEEQVEEPPTPPTKRPRKARKSEDNVSSQESTSSASKKQLKKRTRTSISKQEEQQDEEKHEEEKEDEDDEEEIDSRRTRRRPRRST